ncbi:MAG: hypothetical protein K0V04_13320, partial [Deltaproteobacteria bacterium]|nr:hypothetical protein [Deltaproteobacteria bacterium]
MTEDLDREAGRGHVQTQGGVFPRDAFTTLDYGIRWFGDDGSSGDDNFDPGKPTVIYIHGWQAFSTRSLRRELLTGPSPDASDGEQDWKTAWQGWNVGIFYWNQLADELEVKNAEAKIWAADNGRRGMRFRYVLPGQQGPAPYDVAYEDSPDATPNVPVGALLFESYVANMERYEDGLLTPP